MSDRPSAAVLSRELEKWTAEVSRLNHEVDRCQAELRRVGWDLNSSANLVDFWRRELGKFNKQRGYAKHRMSRCITLLEEQERYVP
jgi:hypothetical protein